MFPLEVQQSIKAEAAVVGSWCLSGNSSYITESEFGIQTKLSTALIWQPAKDGGINVIRQVMDCLESNSNNTIDHD